jgi:hypothetical protein
MDIVIRAKQCQENNGHINMASVVVPEADRPGFSFANCQR